MKKILIVFAPLLLGACSHTANTGLVTPVQVPALPESLAQRAGPLPPSNDLTMGGQVLDNTRNIREYNAVATRYNSLLDLYNCVREAINNEKEFECQ